MRGPQPQAPCGTEAAARRHYRRGEKPLLPIDLCGETDIGPSYEWYREMAEDLTDPPLPVPEVAS